VFHPCAVVPVYNHEHAIGRVTAELRALGLPVILVDDASHAPCAAELDRLQSSDSQVSLVRHSINRGKGGAVMSGLREAKRLGFTHAMQVDADGQHSLGDVPQFLDTARAQPDAVVCGRPLFADDMPPIRFYGRYLSHAMVWLETLSFDIPDSMCGMRLYAIQPMIQLIDSERLGSRMDFDIEVLVRLHWRGVPLKWVETRVSYPKNGVSHYRVVFDNIIVVGMHIRLLLGMLVRAPAILWRRAGKLGRAIP
jgi:glycosyltransferase involved in cell wall biosynthesis